MKQITYIRNNPLTRLGGRSGHVVKDLFTSVILAELFNLRVVFLREAWEKQGILNDVPFGELEPLDGPTLYFGGDGLSHGIDGISWEKFCDIEKQIEESQDGATFKLSNVFRIHLNQVFNWEFEGKLPEGSGQRCVARLRELYHLDHSTPNRDLVLHARRGDVGNPKHRQYAHMGSGNWSAQYFNDTVKKLADTLQPDRVVIISEVRNSKDLHAVEGAIIELGRPDHVAHHFAKMVSANWFVPTSSSLSTWAAYLSRGTVLVPTKTIKHFHHKRLPIHWIPIDTL